MTPMGWSQLDAEGKFFVIPGYDIHLRRYNNMWILDLELGGGALFHKSTSAKAAKRWASAQVSSWAETNRTRLEFLIDRLCGLRTRLDGRPETTKDKRVKG